MRILYFVDSPHFVGGSNIVSLTQAHVMQEIRMCVKVVLPNDDSSLSLF